MLLDIAIPTWNRCEKLDQSLERLHSWVKENDFIRISVYDNCSSDETQAVAEKWIKKFDGRMLYKRNEENVGLIGNYINCINNSSGEYLWVVGDDDVLSPLALGLIARAISDRKKNIDLIALNYRPIDGSTGEVMYPSVFSKDLHKRFPKGSDNFEACFREFYGSLMFITACVLKTSRAKDVICRTKKEMKGNLALPFYVAANCAGSGEMVVIDEVVFDGLYGVGSWKSKSFSVFHIDLPIVLLELFNSGMYTKSLLQTQLAKFPGSLYKPSVLMLKSPVLWCEALKIYRKMVLVNRS